MKTQHTVEGITFTHHPHARSRSMKIRIESDGSVVVSSHPRTSIRSIEAFVAQNVEWILNASEKVKLLRKQNNSDEVSLFGKKYLKVVSMDQALPLGVSFQGENALIRPVSQTDQSVNQTLTRFYKSTAEQYIVPRTHELAKLMGSSFGTITLRQQKTRWGSCSSQGNLNFNWRLVQYPPVIIDYVIIHEVAHLTHMNHSSAFWELVRKYDPAYRSHRAWLKQHGMTVG